MVEWYEDPADRLRQLIDAVEPKFKARFLEVVASLKLAADVDSIRNLLELGRVEDALLAAEAAALRLAGAFSEVYITSGAEAATFIGSQLEVIVDFDMLNERAVEAMRENQLRIVREFTEAQRLTTQQVVVDGIRSGLNPDDVAREVRDSIGLTSYQQRIVANYRRQLESLDRRALDRALRDGRFDRTVLRALREGRPLTGAQIDKMVERYRERWLAYRSRVIARTEALRSVHAGTFEMYQQAVDSGDLHPEDLERKWDTSKLANVRPSHRFMEQQKRRLTEPFLSGNGNLLMLPGDINAPAEDTIECKCAVTTRFSNRARLEAQQLVPQVITTT